MIMSTFHIDDDTIPNRHRVGCLWRLDSGEGNNTTLSIDDKAIEFDDIVKSGRTHLRMQFQYTWTGIRGNACAVPGCRTDQIGSEGLRRLGMVEQPRKWIESTRGIYHELMVQPGLVSRPVWVLYSDNLFESMQSMADAVQFSGSLRTLRWHWSGLPRFSA